MLYILYYYIQDFLVYIKNNGAIKVVIWKGLSSNLTLTLDCKIYTQMNNSPSMNNEWS